MGEGETVVNRRKVAVCGVGNVGKSAITLQFIFNKFVELYDRTIEDIYTRPVSVDSIAYLLEVHDTVAGETWAGEDGAVSRAAVKSSQGFILVYDVGRRGSFTELTEVYEEILRKKECDKIPMVIVGNKCDLNPEARQATTKEGQELAEHYGCPFFEVSGKLNTNITDTFDEIIRQINKSLEAPPPAVASNWWCVLQ